MTKPRKLKLKAKAGYTRQKKKSRGGGKLRSRKDCYLNEGLLPNLREMFHLKPWAETDYRPETTFKRKGGKRKRPEKLGAGERGK